MAHENSETIRRRFPKLGLRWVVIDTAGKNKGVILGPTKGFNTEREATAFAKKRSDTFEKMKRAGRKQPTSR